MSNQISCIFYRNANDLKVGDEVGYCNLDGDWTICCGAIAFCQTPELLRRFSLKMGSKKIKDNWEVIQIR